MSLTATQVKNVKNTGSVQKISDGGGLYLYVSNKGSKLWRMNYRMYGKQKTASFGPYPEISLLDARMSRDEAKKLLRAGVDPIESAKEAKSETATQAVGQKDEMTFEKLSLLFQTKRKREKASYKTLEKYSWLHRRCCSEFGHVETNSLLPADVLVLLQSLEVEDKLDTAARVRMYVGQVMSFGITVKLAERNPAPDLRGAVAAAQPENQASIKEPQKFGSFLCACDSYSGHPVTVIAMQLAPLVVLRSSELREAKWVEIDFEKKLWRVPKERMKGRNFPGDHIVPLSCQVLALLRKLRAITGRRAFMFETMNTIGTPLSENTINQGYRRMGFLKAEVTLHGLRTTFSTFSNEALDIEMRRKWDADWIERQLSHIDDSVRGAYNAAEYLEPRSRLMAWWSDECDQMRGYSVVEKIGSF